jgi:hypothetical protein
MGLVSRLRDKITVALHSSDVESLREALIDETDAALESPPGVRHWYTRVWERFSEFDYGHIDLAQLRRDLDRLEADAPAENTVLHTWVGFSTPTDIPGASVVLSFQAQPSAWSAASATMTEPALVTNQAEAESPWAGSARS